MTYYRFIISFQIDPKEVPDLKSVMTKAGAIKEKTAGEEAPGESSGGLQDVSMSSEVKKEKS